MKAGEQEIYVLVKSLLIFDASVYGGYGLCSTDIRIIVQPTLDTPDEIQVLYELVIERDEMIKAPSVRELITSKTLLVNEVAKNGLPKKYIKED